jgi:hypothetical protein
VFEGEFDRLALSIGLKLFCTGLNLLYCALPAMAVPRRLRELMELGASTSLSKSIHLQPFLESWQSFILVNGFLGISRLW